MHGIVRPLKMLFFSPIIFLLALYMSVTYGLLYLYLQQSLKSSLQPMGGNPSLLAWPLLGWASDFFAGLIVVAKISDKTVVRMTKANNGIFEPEMRLPACIFFACWVPVTFFWYGWTADKHVHVSHAVPAPTTDVVRDPVLTEAKVDRSLHWPYPFRLWHDGIFIPIQPTPSILSLPSLRQVWLLWPSCGRLLGFSPLAGPSMYKALGLGWGNSVLGFIAIGLIPARCWFINLVAQLGRIILCSCEVCILADSCYHSLERDMEHW